MFFFLLLFTKNTKIKNQNIMLLITLTSNKQQPVNVNIEIFLNLKQEIAYNIPKCSIYLPPLLAPKRPPPGLPPRLNPPRPPPPPPPDIRDNSQVK